MLNRRVLLGSAIGAVAAASLPARAAKLRGIENASLRGAIDATEFGVRPGALDDQSRAFIKMLQTASDRDMPLFLPPGVYVVSNITLPRRVRLSGVPGASRIVYGGDGFLFAGERLEMVSIDGVMLDGANRWIGDVARGLIDLREVEHVAVEECHVLGSAKSGIGIEQASGFVERTKVSGAADAGIYAVQAGSLAIRDNSVTDCGNGGILCHRWQAGADGTLITGNRIQRIAARAGGTGQNGNGINVFRADNVIVAGNAIEDCAFSAIRANAASNIQMSSNTCLRSGETGIYAEFGFEGAVVNSNIVDGAANGISVVNFNEGGRMAVCSGNIVRDLSTEGPYPADPPGFGNGITLEADCAATGNVIEGAPQRGMNIGWGRFMRNVVATGNVIRKVHTGIAVSVVEGVGTAVISDNLIDGAPGGGVVGYRWTKPATGDLAVKGAAGFANLTVERNRVV